VYGTIVWNPGLAGSAEQKLKLNNKTDYELLLAIRGYAGRNI
jgi:hypothetical protein